MAFHDALDAELEYVYYSNGSPFDPLLGDLIRHRGLVRSIIRSALD